MSLPEPAGLAAGWRRPHSLTVVSELLRSTYALVALVVFPGESVPYGTVLELVVVAGTFAAAIVRWYTTRYLVDDEAVHFHRGLLWRNRQVLYRSNIQNVSTRSPLLARAVNLAEVQVSDASSTGDVTIRFVGRPEAERLAQLLRAPVVPATDVPAPLAIGGAAPPADPVAPAPPPPVPPPPVAPVPGAGPVTYGPGVVPSWRVSGSAVASHEAVSVRTVVFVAAALVLGVGGRLAGLPGSTVPAVGLFVVAVVTVVGHVLSVGDFAAFSEPDRLRLRMGLTTEQTFTSRRERVQLVRVRRDLLARRWTGLESVILATADVQTANDAARTTYLAPAFPVDEWPPLAIDALGELELAETALQRVSPRTVRRARVRLVPVVVPVAALWFVHPVVMVVALVGAVAAGEWWARRRFARLGYALGERQLMVRRGVFVEDLEVVRLAKIQIVGTSASWFQRRLGLATVRCSCAGPGGGVVVPDLPAETAAALARGLVQHSVATPLAATL